MINEKGATMLISATEIARNLSDVMARVFYKGETFEIKKGNQIVARLMPAEAVSSLKIEDLEDFFQNECHLTHEEALSFETDLKTFKETTLQKKVKDPWA